ncbi:MAG: PASTA domain-containing protein, partial [Armatimonadota bacterium]
EKAERERQEAARKAAEKKAAQERAEAKRKAVEEKAERERQEAARKAAEKKAAQEKAEAKRKAAEEKTAEKEANGDEDEAAEAEEAASTEAEEQTIAPRKPRHPRRRRLGLVAALLVVLGLTTAIGAEIVRNDGPGGGGVVDLLNPPEPSEPVFPKFEGWTRAEVENWQQSLEGDQAVEVSFEKVEGHPQVIIGQSPGPNTPLGGASPLTLQIGTGPRVPDLIGRSPEEAQETLKALGLVYEEEWRNEVTSPEWERNVIRSQTPEAGSEEQPVYVTAGDTVSVVVGVDVKVPTLGVITRAVAEEKLNERRLELSYNENKTHGQATYSQTPRAGEWVASGSTVHLTVVRHVPPPPRRRPPDDDPPPPPR